MAAPQLMQNRHPRSTSPPQAKQRGVAREPPQWGQNFTRRWVGSRLPQWLQCGAAVSRCGFGGAGSVRVVRSARCPGGAKARSGPGFSATATASGSRVTSAASWRRRVVRSGLLLWTVAANSACTSFGAVRAKPPSPAQSLSNRSSYSSLLSSSSARRFALYGTIESQRSARGSGRWSRLGVAAARFRTICRNKRSRSEIASVMVW